MCEMSNTTSLTDVPAGNISLPIYMDMTVQTSLLCRGGDNCCAVKNTYNQCCGSESGQIWNFCLDPDTDPARMKEQINLIYIYF